VNRASEEGPQRFSWWQDWRDQVVVIVASGASAKGVDLKSAQDRVRFIVIKQNVDLCPWAEVVYGCDGAWWQHRRGLPDYRGVRLTWDQRVASLFPNLYHITIHRHADRLLTEEPGVIGDGGNSGFQAFNLAVQFGATRIALVGFEMDDRSGSHWYGRNFWPGANNPDHHNFKRWRRAFDDTPTDLATLNVEVVNTSRHSVLGCFAKHDLAETLERWGV